jgi:hypothetical protein
MVVCYRRFGTNSFLPAVWDKLFVTGGLGQIVYHIYKVQKVRDEKFFKDCLNFEDGTDKLTRNFNKKTTNLRSIKSLKKQISLQCGRCLQSRIEPRLFPLHFPGIFA